MGRTTRRSDGLLIQKEAALLLGVRTQTMGGLLFPGSENAHVLRSILRGMHRATCISLFRSSSHRAWVAYSPTNFVPCSTIGLCSMS